MTKRRSGRRRTYSRSRLNPGGSDAQPVLLVARQSAFLGGQEPDVREEAPGALTPTQTARGCDRHSEVTGPNLKSPAYERDDTKEVLRQEGGSRGSGDLGCGGASPHRLCPGAEGPAWSRGRAGPAVSRSSRMRCRVSLNFGNLPLTVARALLPCPPGPWLLAPPPSRILLLSPSKSRELYSGSGSFSWR